VKFHGEMGWKNIEANPSGQSFPTGFRIVFGRCEGVAWCCFTFSSKNLLKSMWKGRPLDDVPYQML